MDNMHDWKLSSERLRNLVDGLCRDAELDASVDDVEVDQSVLAYARREHWGTRRDMR
jgi:hypothetical protein